MCLTSPTLVFLLLRERTLKTSIKFKAGGGKEKNPNPGNFNYLNTTHKIFTHSITLSLPPAPSVPYIFNQKKKKKREKLHVFYLYYWFMTFRVCHVQSTTCVLSLICRNLSTLDKNIDYFYAIQIGECSRYQVMKEPQRDNNSNMLMSTTKFDFKDTSKFDNASHEHHEQTRRTYLSSRNKGLQTRSMSLCVWPH